MVKKDKIIDFNRRMGGMPINQSGLDYAASISNKQRMRRMASLIRAIAVDHAFTDANKRTAYWVVTNYFKVKNKALMQNAITNIARKNVTDTKKIERMIRNANR
jgi:hypothetical protein